MVALDSWRDLFSQIKVKRDRRMYLKSTSDLHTHLYSLVSTYEHTIQKSIAICTNISLLM